MARRLLKHPVVRSFVLLLSLALLLASGCKSGLISVRDGDAGVGDGSGPSAQAFFEDRVEGMLDDRCGGCHGAGRSAPDFLRPDPDVRTTLLGYPALLDLASPGDSRLVTKGEHTGPALSASQESDVVRWIALEAAEGTMVTPTERELATAPVEVREGFNNLPLDALGMPASSIIFVATRVGDGVFLDGVQIATGPMGARLDHPVFVTWIEGAPHPDPVDRFAGLTLTVEPNSTASFDTGTVILTDLPEGALLSVHFTAAGPMTTPVVPGTDAGVGGPAPSGCTELDAFRENAVGPLTTFCLRCHGGGNASATASIDMSDVDATGDAALRNGCNQILGRISPDMPSASGLFTQPDPSSTSGHDFRFGTTGELENFRSSILAWFSAEVP
jgi:hypothetical protein